MSGLEIPALIVGIAGAAAGTASAYKDLTEKRSGAVYRSSTTTQVGNVVQRTTKVCATTGDGDAGIKSNGDMYASSSGQGSAMASYAMERKPWK